MNRKKDTITLPPGLWTVLDGIGPSRGRAVESLIEEHMRTIMINLNKDGLRFGKSGSLNFTIEKAMIVSKGKRAGEITWKSLGHFPTLSLCAKKLLSACTNVDSISTVQALIDQLGDTESRIIDTLNGVDIRLHITDGSEQTLSVAIDNALKAAPKGNGKRIEFSPPTRLFDPSCRWFLTDCVKEECQGCQTVSTVEGEMVMYTSMESGWYDCKGDWKCSVSSGGDDLDVIKKFVTAIERGEWIPEGEPHVFRNLVNRMTYTVPNSKYSLESFRARVLTDV